MVATAIATATATVMAARRQPRQRDDAIIMATVPRQLPAQP
jgi:hypothetical protein